MKVVEQQAHPWQEGAWPDGDDMDEGAADFQEFDYSETYYQHGDWNDDLFEDLLEEGPEGKPTWFWTSHCHP